MKRSLLFCIVWTWLSFQSTTQTLWAGGTLVNTFAARTAGRAGVNLAFTDNGVLLHDNPAGLLGATQPRREGQVGGLFDVGIGGLFPDLEYGDTENSLTSATNDPFGVGYLSYAEQINEQLAVGIGVFSPAGFGARWTLEGPPQVLPGPQLYKSIGMMLRVLPGVSYRPSERLTLGATLGVAVSHVELEAPYFINSAPLTGTPTYLDLQGTGAALTWSSGLQYQLSDCTMLAARYQSQNRFQNDGNARVSVPGLGSAFYDSTLDIVWPRSVGVGFLHALGSNQRLGVDVDWEQWSRAFNHLDLHLRDSDNPVFDAVAGPQVDDQFPLNWRDTVVVRTGYELDICSHQTLRLGYAYNRNPIPFGTANVYLPTSLTHHFTLGYGTERRGWEFDAAYQFAFGPEMRTATSDIAGGDYSNSVQSTQTHWLFLSMMQRF